MKGAPAFQGLTGLRTFLTQRDDRLSVAILDIAKSRQFLNRRNE